MTQLQESLDETDRQLKEATASCRQLETALEQKQSVVERQHGKMRELSEQLSAIEQEKRELIAVQEASCEEKEKLLGQVDTLQSRLSTTEDSLQQYHVRGTALESLKLHQSEEISGLKEESQKVPGLLADLQQRHAELDSARLESENRKRLIADVETELGQLKQQLSDFDTTKEQLESVAEELVTVSNDRDQLIQTRRDLEDTVTNLRNRVSTQTAKVKEVNELLSARSQEHLSVKSDLQKELDQRHASMKQLNRELDEKTRQHDQIVKEIAKLTEKLDRQQSKINELVAELREAKKLGPENKQLQDRVADLTAHLKRLSDELEDSLDMNAKAHDSIRGMENQLHEHVVKIRELRRDRGSIPSLDTNHANDNSDDGQQRAA